MSDNAGEAHRDWGISFSTKLVLVTCSLVLLTGATIIWVAYRSARANAHGLANSLFREVSGHAVTHTRAFLAPAPPAVESLRELADQGLALDDSERLARQLLPILRSNPGMSWVMYGDEAGAFTGVYRTVDGTVRVNQSRIVEGRSPLVEHEVSADGVWKVVRRDDDNGYDPRARPYYLKATERGRLVWLPPYIFYEQGVPGISCAAPVTDAAGKLRGVLSVDFDLNALSDFVSKLSLSEHSRIFLFTSDQLLLAHPDLPRINAVGRRGEGKLLTLADAADPLVDAFRQQLRPEALRRHGGDGFYMFQLGGTGEAYLASATVFPVGDDQTWVVGAVAPERDFLAGVWRSQRLALTAAGTAVLVAVLLAMALARRVSGPVSALIAFMQRVGAGDLESRAQFGGGREFRQLSAALNAMIADLRDRLRLRHSLDVAMQVQQQLLPRHPPVVPGLDIAGHSTYCDETGGDYYDFLIVDEASPGTVIVALGDVMGHGVAAALVMSAARAVLRDRAGTDGSLAHLMRRLNGMLAADLDGTRFMTMHLALVDARGGCYRWVSAGHDPAFTYDPDTDSFDERTEGGLPLGVLADGAYEEHAFGPLRPGQVIVVGTDGVWEMPNAQGEQFGKDRLREVIRRAASGTAADVVDAIVASLAKFRGECKLVDDVTFVVMKPQPVTAHHLAELNRA
jgi:sigma-B regulation protein RsbU (phosphoserine phosphatase)